MSAESVNRQLVKEFGPTYRLRPSVEREGQWCVEQQIGRRTIDIPPCVEKDGTTRVTDDWVRARDGYVLTMDILSGDRMPCPRCHSTLNVPFAETREVVCGKCGAKRIAAHFTFDGDALVQALRRMDRLRGDARAVKRYLADRRFARDEAHNKSFVNGIDDISRDIFPNVAGIPQVGYTGKKEFTL